MGDTAITEPHLDIPSETWCRSILGLPRPKRRFRLRYRPPSLDRRSGSYRHLAILPALSLLNAAIGLILPILFGPAAFGRYALAATLFQYGLIFDFGTSQLFDRNIPALLGRGETDEAARVIDELLWLRLFIGLAGVALAFGLLFVNSASERFAWSLSLVAGLLFMIGNGPASIYRAKSEAREYALAVLLLNSGLIVARPLGAAWSGLEGCFAAMVLWYMASSAWLQGQVPLRASALPRPSMIIRLLIAGLPLFTASITWAFFTSANRWFASLVTTPLELGHFAFGSNILYLVVGTLGGLSAFYYPTIARRIATCPPLSCSSAIGRDHLLLILAVAMLSTIGILASPTFIRLIYRAYEPSVAATQILLIATTPMVLASWLMPLSLAVGRHSWLACLGVYPPAVVALGTAVLLLHGPFGLLGIAAASTVSAIMLVTLQLAMLLHDRVLRWRDGLLLWGATVSVATGLALLTRACLP